jgi:hypothetical protein
VLIDALHEEQADRSRELEIHAAAEEFHRKIAARVERHRAIRRQELARLLEPIRARRIGRRRSSVCLRG